MTRKFPSSKVLLTDVNQAAGDKTLAELTAKYDQSRVAFVQCDITKQEQLESKQLSSVILFVFMFALAHTQFLTFTTILDLLLCFTSLIIYVSITWVSLL